MGNGPDRATQIPAEFKPSRAVPLWAELRVVLGHAGVLSGWEQHWKSAGHSGSQQLDIQVHSGAHFFECHSPPAQQRGGRNSCTSPGGFAMGFIPPGPPGDEVAEGT